jgi:hypothetical protein
MLSPEEMGFLYLAQVLLYSVNTSGSEGSIRSNPLTGLARISAALCRLLAERHSSAS